MNQAFLLATAFSALKFRYFPSGGVAKTQNCAPVQGGTRILFGFPPCARTQFRFFAHLSRKSGFSGVLRGFGCLIYAGSPQA